MTPNLKAHQLLLSSRGLSLGLVSSLLFLPLSCASQDSARVGPYVERADRYFKGKDFPQAIQQCQKGLAIDPENYRLNQIIGEIYLRNGSRNPKAFEAALKQFKKVHSLRGTGEHDYITLLGLARANYGLGREDLAKSRELLRRIQNLKLSPTEKQTTKAQALELQRSYLQRLDQAERWLKEMLARGDGILPALQTLFMVQVDRIYPLSGKKRDKQIKIATEAGEAWLREILRRKEYYKKKADSLSSNENLSGKVIVVIENEMKKRYEHFIDLELQARGLLHSLYFRAHQPRKALAHLNAILKIDPTQADEYYNRGQVYLRLGERAKAKKDLETFLRLSPLPEDSPRWREVNREVARLALELKAGK